MSKIPSEERPCVVSPDCLLCPLSACKYDDPGPYKSWLNARPTRLLLAMAASGETISEMALALGVRERTVHRRLARVGAEARIWEMPGGGILDQTVLR